MIRRVIWAAVLACIALSACSKAGDKPQASRDQVLAYLDDHPEVINEASQRYELKLRKMQMAQAAKAIALHKVALERDPRDFVANPNGKVTVTEFFDYRCPYCKADQAALKSLIDNDKDIRFVFKEYPIIPDKDGQIGVSLRAAEAALAAKRAGKYIPVHDALMAAPDLDDAVISQVMRDHGLDPVLIKATPDDLRQLADVRKLAQDIHVGGTPTFIVGDTMVDSSSMPQLAAAIEQARKAAKS